MTRTSYRALGLASLAALGVFASGGTALALAPDGTKIGFETAEQLVAKRQAIAEAREAKARAKLQAALKKDNAGAADAVGKEAKSASAGSVLTPSEDKTKKKKTSSAN